MSIAFALCSFLFFIANFHFQRVTGASGFGSHESKMIPHIIHIGPASLLGYCISLFIGSALWHLTKGHITTGSHDECAMLPRWGKYFSKLCPKVSSFHVIQIEHNSIRNIYSHTRLHAGIVNFVLEPLFYHDSDKHYWLTMVFFFHTQWKLACQQPSERRNHMMIANTHVP
jgi:hypothetical protein